MATSPRDPNSSKNKQLVLSQRIKCSKSSSRGNFAKSISITRYHTMITITIKLFWKPKQLHKDKTLSKMSKHMQFPSDFHMTHKVT